MGKNADRLESTERKRLDFLGNNLQKVRRGNQGEEQKKKLGGGKKNKAKALFEGGTNNGAVSEGPGRGGEKTYEDLKIVFKISRKGGKKKVTETNL